MVSKKTNKLKSCEYFDELLIHEYRELKCRFGNFHIMVRYVHIHVGIDYIDVVNRNKSLIYYVILTQTKVHILHRLLFGIVYNSTVQLRVSHVFVP